MQRQKQQRSAMRIDREKPPGMGQHGFTLVEVLVTVVILAVGLLGLAGLQAVSMRNNHSAYERTQAVQLAYDMADRVRANTPAVPAPAGAMPLRWRKTTSMNGCYW
jgi:type IV pilus modification protein PilV